MRFYNADIPRIISTHAPRTGSDYAVISYAEMEVRFQPTLPARGATQKVKQGHTVTSFQPTLPARGAT